MVWWKKYDIAEESWLYMPYWDFIQNPQKTWNEKIDDLRSDSSSPINFHYNAMKEVYGDRVIMSSELYSKHRVFLSSVMDTVVQAHLKQSPQSLLTLFPKYIQDWEEWQWKEILWDSIVYVSQQWVDKKIPLAELTNRYFDFMKWISELVSQSNYSGNERLEKKESVHWPKASLDRVYLFDTILQYRISGKNYVFHEWGVSMHTYVKERHESNMAEMYAYLKESPDFKDLPQDMNFVIVPVAYNNLLSTGPAKIALIKNLYNTTNQFDLLESWWKFAQFLTKKQRSAIRNTFEKLRKDIVDAFDPKYLSGKMWEARWFETQYDILASGAELSQVYGTEQWERTYEKTRAFFDKKLSPEIQKNNRIPKKVKNK